MGIRMIIEKKKLSELKPAPYNPRQSTAKQEAQLKTSLEKFGVVEPIIYNKQTGYIVGGHFRVRELTKLGYKEVECVIVDLNEEDERELNIRLNANTGGWDWDSLANEWDVEKLDDWGLDLPIDLSVKELEAEEDDFDVPEGGIETDIVLGDLFEIGEHRLLCGSSTNADDVVKLMNGNKANMVFTDHPYGVSYVGGVIHGNKINTNHKRDMLKNDEIDVYADFISLLPLVIDNGALYIFYATRNSYELFKPLKENGIDIMSVLAWIKINTGYADMNSHYKNRYEPFVYCKIGQKTNFIGATTENTTWEIEKDRDNKLHPTQKPISVPLRAIGNHDAEIIADLFLGSGSTMVASHQLKRKCYGMELDPKYCQVIIDRMKKLDPTLVIKKNGVTMI
jgi:DNA modification methylase